MINKRTTAGAAVVLFLFTCHAFAVALTPSEQPITDRAITLVVEPIFGVASLNTGGVLVDDLEVRLFGELIGDFQDTQLQNFTVGHWEGLSLDHIVAGTEVTATFADGTPSDAFRPLVHMLGSNRPPAYSVSVDFVLGEPCRSVSVGCELPSGSFHLFAGLNEDGRLTHGLIMVGDGAFGVRPSGAYSDPLDYRILTGQLLGSDLGELSRAVLMPGERELALEGSHSCIREHPIESISFEDRHTDALQFDSGSEYVLDFGTNRPVRVLNDSRVSIRENVLSTNHQLPALEVSGASAHLQDALIRSSGFDIAAAHLTEGSEMTVQSGSIVSWSTGLVTRDSTFSIFDGEISAEWVFLHAEGDSQISAVRSNLRAGGIFTQGFILRGDSVFEAEDSTIETTGGDQGAVALLADRSRFTMVGGEIDGFGGEFGTTFFDVTGHAALDIRHANVKLTSDGNLAFSGAGSSTIKLSDVDLNHLYSDSGGFQLLHAKNDSIVAFSDVRVTGRESNIGSEFVLEGSGSSQVRFDDSVIDVALFSDRATIVGVGNDARLLIDGGRISVTYDDFSGGAFATREILASGSSEIILADTVFEVADSHRVDQNVEEFEIVDIEARDSSTVTLIATSFNYPTEQPLVDLTGMIEGALPDGTPFSYRFDRDPTATIVLRESIYGDYDRDSALSASDLDVQAAAMRDGTTLKRFDLNDDGIADFQDRAFWVETIKNTYMGDANLDGQFDSQDLVRAFEAALYEDESGQLAAWESGDWTGDGRFDSADLVAAFQANGYEAGPRPATVPEPAFLWQGLMALLAMLRWARSVIVSDVRHAM